MENQLFAEMLVVADFVYLFVEGIRAWPAESLKNPYQHNPNRRLLIHLFKSNIT